MSMELMGDYSGKKAIAGLSVRRKGLGPVLKDTATSKNEKVQFCNRIGCSGRMKSTKGTQLGGLEKSTPPVRPLFRTSSGKDMTGSSSRASSSQNCPKKSSEGSESTPDEVGSSSLASSTRKPKNLIKKSGLGKQNVSRGPSVSLTPKSTNSSRQSMRNLRCDSTPNATESSCSPSDFGHETESELHPNPKCSEGSESTREEVGSASLVPSTGKPKNLIKKSGLGKQDVSRVPSAPLTPKSTNSSRHSLRKMRCDSTSDATESGCSSSDLGQNKKKISVAKKNSVGENSSFTKGKKSIEPSVQSSSSSNGVSISDSRRTRNLSLPDRDNGARRSINGTPRIRPSSKNNSNVSSYNQSPIMMRQMAEPEVSFPSSPRQISSQSRSRILNSYSRLGSSSSGSARSRFPGSLSRAGINRRALMNRDGFQLSHMNGVAEVSYALESFEQDEELSYEQQLDWGTNLSLNGLSFYDQHRDMRLDIDNMSYEELLALEEKMGTVSTALTEEALEKFITSSIHKTTSSEPRLAGNDGDDKNADVKCSICQEEYIEGDELGRLQCEHSYHLNCIHQWLRLKNWCPICKISAATSLS